MVELDPRIVVWEYTLMCDSGCLHCGSDAKRARFDELDSDEALELVEKIDDIGFERIILSGGEPTLRSDWAKTAYEITEKGMELGIISNALNWDDSTIDDLERVSPFSVGFSVDGEEKTHDYLRGVDGSFEKVFENIRKVKDRGLATCAITTVNSRNIDELVALRNRMIIYSVDAWQLQTLSPMGKMKGNRDLVLSNDDYVRLAEFVCETRERLPQMNVQAGDCIGYYGKLEGRLHDSSWAGCHAGIYGLGIESNGNVKGCLSMQADVAIEGNVRDDFLSDIWYDTTKFKYNRDFDVNSLNGECSGCDYGEKCRGGCQSQSLAFFDEFHNAPYCLSRIENGKK
jgi:radical SAM protein with 4Fe4S-binding SPASM domain